MTKAELHIMSEGEKNIFHFKDIQYKPLTFKKRINIGKYSDEMILPKGWKGVVTLEERQQFDRINIIQKNMGMSWLDDVFLYTKQGNEIICFRYINFDDSIIEQNEVLTLGWHAAIRSINS